MLPQLICTAQATLNPQNLALPAVIAAATANSLNPCAIGMLIFLLGYLVVFAPDYRGGPFGAETSKAKVLKTGLLYISVMFVTYFTLGFVFYSNLQPLLINPTYKVISYYLKIVLSILIVLAGLINLKDTKWPTIGPSLEIPQRFRPFLGRLVTRATYPATAILAFFVTLFETPCAFPLYAGTLGILSKCDLSSLQLFGYLVLYNFIFVLPLLILLVIIWGGTELVRIKEWEHKYRNKLKLVTGLMLTIMGILLLLI